MVEKSENTDRGNKGHSVSFSRYEHGGGPWVYFGVALEPATWVQIPALSLTTCDVDSSFHLSDLRFFTCEMRIIIAPTDRIVWELNEAKALTTVHGTHEALSTFPQCSLFIYIFPYKDAIIL